MYRNISGCMRNVIVHLYGRFKTVLALWKLSLQYAQAMPRYSTAQESGVRKNHRQLTVVSLQSNIMNYSNFGKFSLPGTCNRQLLETKDDLAQHRLFASQPVLKEMI